MAKEGIYDKVVTGVTEKIEEASGTISRDFKNIKPFLKESIDNSEILESYVRLTPQDMQWLIQRHGQEKVNDFIGEMEILKAKRLGYA